MCQHRKALTLSLLLVSAILLVRFVRGKSENTNTTATSTVTPPPTQTLTLIPRPQKIVDLMKARGEQDEAKPTIKIVSPAKDAVINGSKVEVETRSQRRFKGLHAAQGSSHRQRQSHSRHPRQSTLRGLLRIGPAVRAAQCSRRQTHAASFSVAALARKLQERRRLSDGVVHGEGWRRRYQADDHQQRPDGGEQQLPVRQLLRRARAKTIAASTAGDVDPTKPLLTYSRPKGEYKGEDADPIMIDFWLTGAKLKGDGGEYRVRYIVDDDEPKFIDKWEPIWLSGWLNGKHTVRLELLDKDGKPVENGGYNTTSREIRW